MALSIQLPLQAIQYISTQNTFRANFGVPRLGKYDFSVAGNQNQIVIPLEINSLYIVERMFISGGIPSEQFLSSIDFSLGDDYQPHITLRRKLAGINTHVRKIPVAQFTSNREAPILVATDKKGDELQISLNGVCIQIPDTVGVDPLILCCGLSIYQCNESSFNIGMKTALLSEFGLDKRKLS